MASGQITKPLASYFRMEIDWNSVPNAANNSSTVTAKLYIRSLHSAATIVAPKNMWANVIINGNNYQTSRPHMVSVGGNQRKFLVQHTVVVPHNADGTRTVAIGGGFEWGIVINGEGGSSKHLEGNAVLNKLGGNDGPPSTPHVTYPTTSVVVDKGFELRWSGGISPSGLTLQHQIAIAKDGSAYEYSPWYSGNPGKSFIDTSSWSETKNARVAVIVKDSKGRSSAFAYSAFFEVKHNDIVYPPVITTPKPGDTSFPDETIRVNWDYKGAGNQTAYSIQWKSVTDSGWKSLSIVNTTRTYHDFVNFFSVGVYQVRVDVRSSNGKWSAYSEPVIINVKNRTPAPTIISPVNGQSMSNGYFNVRWNSTTVQERWNVKIVDSDGFVVGEREGTSNVNSTTIAVPVENGEQYQVRVMTRNSGVWSNYSAVTVRISFTPPPAANLTMAEGLPEQGAMELSWEYEYFSSNLLPPITETDKFEGVDFADSINQEIKKTFGGSDTMSITAAITDRIEMYKFAFRQPQGIGVAVKIDVLDMSGNIIIPGNFDYNGSGGLLVYTFNTIPGATHVRITFKPDDKYSFVVYSPMLGVDFDNGYYEQQSDTDFVRPIIFVVQRREGGDGAWVNLAVLGADQRGYIDNTVKSNLSHDYRIAAIGENDIVSYSNILAGFVMIQHGWLTLASDPNIGISMQIEDEREEEMVIDSELNHFTGRRYPVREFSEFESNTITITWVVDEVPEVNYVRDLIRSRELMLYRDSGGRKWYCTTDNLTVNDRQVYGYVLSTTLARTDYTEGVDFDVEA